MIKLVRTAFIASMMGAVAHMAWAQTGNGLDNLDWVEDKEPPPPAFSAARVIPLDMPNYVSVRVGIDPATINVGKDGVVRYVVVMSNSNGTVNAAYEGIRCASDQVKIYARAGASAEWSLLPEPAWRDLNGNQPSRHAFVFARSAACESRVASHPEEIVRALQTPRKPSSRSKQSFD